MTLMAYTVLKDCETILYDLSKVPQDAREDDLWRPKWVSLAALLRAVGHVLDKVDGNTCPKARKVVHRAWENLKENEPEPRIFSEFIECERNNILKIYEFGPRYKLTVCPGGIWLNRAAGEIGNYPSGPTTYEYFMRSGAFKGRNPLALCREAIAFWRAYLGRVEQQMASDES